jgi:hypothetical protein
MQTGANGFVLRRRMTGTVFKSGAALTSDSDFVLLGARSDVSASAFAEWVATHRMAGSQR